MWREMERERKAADRRGEDLQIRNDSQVRLMKTDGQDIHLSLITSTLFKPYKVVSGLCIIVYYYTLR